MELSVEILRGRNFPRDMFRRRNFSVGDFFLENILQWGRPFLRHDLKNYKKLNNKNKIFFN